MISSNSDQKGAVHCVKNSFLSSTYIKKIHIFSLTVKTRKKTYHSVQLQTTGNIDNIIGPEGRKLSHLKGFDICFDSVSFSYKSFIQNVLHATYTYSLQCKSPKYCLTEHQVGGEIIDPVWLLYCCADFKCKMRLDKNRFDYAAP